MSATNQDIDLNGSTDQKISLDGVGAYESVKSIKFGDYDLGSDINKLAIPDDLKKDYANHGAAELLVVVHSGADGDVIATDHTIKVPVTLLTKAIASADDLKTYVQLSTANIAVQGYYKQTADINNPATSGFDSSYYFAGTYDGGDKKITVNGSTLSNGLFGQLGKDNSTGTEIQATVKNLTVVDTWYNAGGSHALLAKSVWNTLFDNVKVSNTAGGTNAGKLEEGNGWLCYSRCRNSKFVKCSFDASAINLGSLLGGGSNYTDSVTFENCTLKAKSYMCVYWKGSLATPTKVATIDGLAIDTNTTLVE